MFISDIVSCGNDLSTLVSHSTKRKLILLVLNLFPSKSIESPFVPLWQSGTACVKINHYFMYRYQCSLLLLIFSMSFHKITFYALHVKIKHSGFQFLKDILLIRTYFLPHVSMCFQNNTACIPRANWDAWFSCSYKKKIKNCMCYFLCTEIWDTSLKIKL